VSERRSVWRSLYDGWLAIASRFGHVQTLVILSIFYVVILGPIALGIAVARGDLLAKRGLGLLGSTWREAESTPPEMERARRQF